MREKPQNYYDAAYYDTDVTKGYPGPYTMVCAPWGRLARALVFTFGVLGVDSVTDFGCARGFVLWHLKTAGWLTKGYDFSEYAVSTAVEGLDIEVADIAAKRREFQPADLTLCTDVLEHLEGKRLMQALLNIRAATQRVFVAQVFLPEVDYFGPQNDMPEHVTVHDRPWWQTKFEECGFRMHVLDGEYKLNVRRMCLRPFGEIWANSTFVLEPVAIPESTVIEKREKTQYAEYPEQIEDGATVAVESGWPMADARLPRETEIFQ